MVKQTDPVKRAEALKNIKEAALRRSQDPEYRKKIKEAAIKRSQNPEWKRKQKEAREIFSQDPEYKHSMIEGAKKRSQDPEWQRKHKEMIEKRSQDPEYRKKMKDIAIRRSQDPEWLLKNKDMCEKRSQDPEWREKISKANTGKVPWNKGIPMKEESKELLRQVNIDKKLAQETKDKISQSNIGKHCGELNPMFGKIPWNKGKTSPDEVNKKISESNNGKKRTKEVKERMSEFRKELWKDPEYRAHLIKILKISLLGENNPNYGKIASQETRDKMSEGHKGKLTGEDNPNWNGGITPLRKSIRESTEMYEWKRKVMERDDYRDADTGERGEFEVHHIIPLEELLQKYNIQTLDDARNCKELWDINNGKTMLYENHRKFHGLMGGDEDD